ncbi:MAG: YIP1 family protein [Rhodobacteraceae bacterium]|nr:YIP1 family protein [Paracoccaceae bacterium]
MTPMFRQLMLDTLLRPRVAARAVLDLGLAPGPLMQAAVAVTCLGMVLSYAAARLTVGGVDAVTAAILYDPLLGAAMQLGMLAFAVVATALVGRQFGGRGDITGALAVIVWLNVVLLALQLVQIAALLVMPPLASLLAVATLIWLIWAFACFVTELHGFSNPLKVLGGVIACMIVLFFGLTVLVAMLGLAPQGGG